MAELTPAYAGEWRFDPTRTRIGFSTRHPMDRQADRDQHLRTNDFFDAPRFPEIAFVSNRVDHVDEQHSIVSGDVTICCVTKEISIPIDFIGVERHPMG